MEYLFNHALHKYYQELPKRYGFIYLNYYIELAEQKICLQFSNQELMMYYTESIAHLEQPLGHFAADFTIYVLDIATLYNGDVIEWEREIFAICYQKTSTALSSAHKTRDTRHINLGDVSYYYQRHMRFGYWLIKNLQNLSYWHRANPLRFLWYDLLINKSVQVSHAAAVSNHQHAALLVGHSGAGNSSTALSAHLYQHLNILGDDHCLFTVHPVPQVFSLYRSVKIDAHKELTAFNKLKISYYIKNENIEKKVFCIKSKNNDSSKKTIQYILLMNQAHHKKPGFYNVSKQTVLKSFLISTITQAPIVNSRHVIANHIALLDRVSYYQFCLSRNFEENAYLLRQLLDDHP